MLHLHAGRNLVGRGSVKAEGTRRGCGHMAKALSGEGLCHGEENRVLQAGTVCKHQGPSCLWQLPANCSRHKKHRRVEKPSRFGLTARGRQTWTNHTCRDAWHVGWPRPVGTVQMPARRMQHKAPAGEPAQRLLSHQIKPLQFLAPQRQRISCTPSQRATSSRLAPPASSTGSDS
jgi:hypothetical protein